MGVVWITIPRTDNITFDFTDGNGKLWAISSSGRKHDLFNILAWGNMDSVLLTLSLCLLSLPCSLSAGIDNDVCCDAAVRDGPACLTLPGALHPDNLCSLGWVQRRDEEVLGWNHIWGKRIRELKVFLNRSNSAAVFDKCTSTSLVLFNRVLIYSEACHTSWIWHHANIAASNLALPYLKHWSTQQGILPRQILTACPQDYMFEYGLKGLMQY